MKKLKEKRKIYGGVGEGGGWVNMDEEMKHLGIFQ